MIACEPMKYTEIAKKLNITVKTIWNYRQHAEFNQKAGQIAARADRAAIDVQIAIRYNLLTGHN